MTTLTNKELYFLLLFMFVLLADTFCECRRLESVAMANSVTYLGSYAFRGCLSLTSVQLSNSLTIILGNTFAGCTNLSSISLPNSVLGISYGAFSNSGLTSFVVPDSVTYIPSDIFSGVSARAPGSTTVICLQQQQKLRVCSVPLCSVTVRSVLLRLKSAVLGNATFHFSNNLRVTSE
jgi:hypothetical protein